MTLLYIYDMVPIFREFRICRLRWVERDKDAKDLVDAAPKVIKEKIGKEEAEAMKKKLEEAGATVTLK